jgi:long-chain acyl-CoA synthetase
MPITDGFVGAARRRPERPAVIEGADERSYGDLLRAVERLAGALRARIGGGGTVGLLMRPGPGFLEVFLASSRAGLAAMVLDTAWSRAELERALAANPPDLLFADRHNAPLLPRGFPASRVICGDDPSAIGAAGHEAGGRPWTGEVDDEAPFLIAFTSGTTGHPKGFLRSHRSWLRSFDAASRELGVGQNDSLLVPGPLDHTHFLFAAVHGLHLGASVHLQRRFDADGVLDLVERGSVTRLYVVPTMLAALRAAAERRSPRGAGGAPALRSIISAGAKWDADDKARCGELFGAAEPIEYFGASELSFVSVARPSEGAPPESVGRPFAGVEVSIRRPDGSEVPDGEAGRLYVRSDMLFSGYLRPEDASPDDVDGWISVGDRARRDERGFLHVLGRERDMVISGGLNVYPEEVEGVLLGLAEVEEVGVFGLPDEYWGETLCAVLRWCGDARLGREALRRHCLARLARYKCPRVFWAADHLPRTSTGKIARARLRDALRTGALGVEEIR